MTRHMTSKHRYPINDKEMSLARLKSTQEAETTKELKQKSILSSAQKKLVFHKPMGSEIKEEHQWNVVEYILTECLPFNTMEKKSFRDLPGLLNTVPRWIEGQYKDLLSKKMARLYQGYDSIYSTKWHLSLWMIGQAQQSRTIQAWLLTISRIIWILQQCNIGCFLHEEKTTATAIKEDYEHFQRARF
jgi:hypothetical protein